MSEPWKRRSKPRPITDFLPVNGDGKFRRHWVKVWIERLRSSPRVHAAGYEAMGLWLMAMTYAAEHDGVLPMTDKQLAKVLGRERCDRRGNFNKHLDKLLEVGLFGRTEDGFIHIPRFMEMQ